jgi:superfamily II DNA helicase RecQ
MFRALPRAATSPGRAATSGGPRAAMHAALGGAAAPRPAPRDIHEVLKEVWGYTAFRGCQEVRARAPRRAARAGPPPPPQPPPPAAQNQTLALTSSPHPPTQAAIRGVMAGRDQMVVMATGGGKSLVYQVAPLAAGRPAVVVSPLISLMQDQVMALTARGVKAAYLGSAQADAGVAAAAWAGEYSVSGVPGRRGI